MKNLVHVTVSDSRCILRAAPVLTRVQVGRVPIPPVMFGVRLLVTSPWCFSVSRRSSASVETSVARPRGDFHSRPGSRVVISWSSQPFPSGSLNEANE